MSKVNAKNTKKRMEKPAASEKRPRTKPLGGSQTRKEGGLGTGRAVRQNTKQARLIAMLEAPKGATVQELVEALGWQPHSVRGAISGTIKKKLGLEIKTEQSPRGRVYRTGKRA